jgi:non-specific serine/threonine protein kinase
MTIATLPDRQATAAPLPAPGSINPSLAPLLTPRGHLLLAADADQSPLPAELGQRLAAAFARGAGHGLLQLGAAEVASILPPDLAWWRDFAARYVTALCATAEAADIAAPAEQTLDALIADAPPMRGGEYLTADVLRALWSTLDAALRLELAAANCPLQDFLKARHPAWNLVGRVYFNLRSPFSPPTPRACRLMARLSTCRCRRPCRSSPTAAARRGCSRC